MPDETTPDTENTVDANKAFAAVAALIGYAMVTAAVVVLFGKWALIGFLGLTIIRIAREQIE